MSELDTFPAPPHAGEAVYTFQTDELTAHCPFDFGGPDYYELTIRYEPDQMALESKSLKKYLESFRSQESTAEEIGSAIHRALKYELEPEALYVRLEQARRGGIEETVEVGDRGLRE